MTITRDELKSLKYEDIINKIKEAVKREDKEFIMSIIPLFDHFAEEAADKGRDIYGELKDYLEDSEIIKDRNIALKLAEYGYAVPEDLYPGRGGDGGNRDVFPFHRDGRYLGGQR